MQEPLDINGRPVVCNLEWPEDRTPGLFIGKLVVEASALERFGTGKSGRDLLVFGTKHPEAAPGHPSAYRAEYVVLEQRADGYNQVHLLAQRNSVMFRRVEDLDERQMVDMLKKADMPSASRPPRWKATDAAWPFRANKPFLFVGQLYVPETPATKERFFWDETVFVFVWLSPTDDLQVQIFQQDTSAQTAEDHYRLEAMMQELDTHLGNLEVVRRLAKHADRHFFDYLFEHPRLDRGTLEVVAADAPTKSIRDRANRELRRRR